MSRQLKNDHETWLGPCGSATGSAVPAVLPRHSRLPVPADDLWEGTFSEPCRQGVTITAVDEIDGPACFQINHDGAVPVSPADGEIIDTQAPHPPGRLIRDRPDQTQQRVPADTDTQPGRRPDPGPSCQRQPDRGQYPLKRQRVTGIGPRQLRDLLGERRSRTGGVHIPEPADHQNDDQACRRPPPTRANDPPPGTPPACGEDSAGPRFK